MVTVPHYQVEDIPPMDVETQLAMYQQSREVVANGLELGLALVGEIAPLLEGLYQEAQAQGDSDAMAIVNRTWAKAQDLSNLVSQQNAALNGADNVIQVMGESRKALSNELHQLIRGLERVNPSVHPKLAAFAERFLEEEAEMWYTQELDDLEQGYLDAISATVGELVEHESRGVRRHAAREMLQLLTGNTKPSQEQSQLMKRLLLTCLPAAIRADYLSDEYDFDDIEDFG